MSYTKDAHFSENMKKLRKELGITQQQMADIIGVRKTTICNYESGYSLPTLDTVAKMIEYFHLPANFFVEDHEVRTKAEQALYGITIPFYKHTNIAGLKSKDRFLKDSPLTLPTLIHFPKCGCIATIAPDNSMNLAQIKKGSGIVIHTSEDIKDGDIFAAIFNDKLIIRRFHNNVSGTYMSTESTRIPLGISDEKFSKEDLFILGPVVKVINDV